MRRYFYYVVSSEVEILKPGQVFLAEDPVTNFIGKPLKKGEEGSLEFYDEKKRKFVYARVKYLGYADFKDEEDLRKRGIDLIEKKLKGVEGALE